MAALLALVLWTLLAAPAAAQRVRIEELCEVEGVRPNQLIGYGIVAGLNNTGDQGQARFTNQSTAAMLRRLGATVDPHTIQTRNAAAVMVTAILPPFARPGTTVDVNISSLGNARSLRGGTLLQTALYAADRQVYAVAQGPVMVGGFAAQGQSGSTLLSNHVTAGRVPGGAIVERAVAMPGLRGKELVLSLRRPNFVTAQRIVAEINSKLGNEVASAVSSGSIRLGLAEASSSKAVELLAQVQLLEVEPDHVARVVIDERTGTVVLGSGVRISEAAVAQGGLTVQVAEEFAVSQPNGGALIGGGNLGTTAVVPKTTIDAKTQAGAVQSMKASASLAEVVAALNALGAKPLDLIAIFQALKSAGALQAELVIQ